MGVGVGIGVAAGFEDGFFVGGGGGVAVGGTSVAVGGTSVAVGGTSVAVGGEVGVSVKPSAALATVVGRPSSRVNESSTAMTRETMPIVTNTLVLVIVVTSQSSLYRQCLLGSPHHDWHENLVWPRHLGQIQFHRRVAKEDECIIKVYFPDSSFSSDSGLP